jgi:hypothetical protein
MSRIAVEIADLGEPQTIPGAFLDRRPDRLSVESDPKD